MTNFLLKQKTGIKIYFRIACPKSGLIPEYFALP